MNTARLPGACSLPGMTTTTQNPGDDAVNALLDARGPEAIEAARFVLRSLGVPRWTVDQMRQIHHSAVSAATTQEQ